MKTKIFQGTCVENPFGRIEELVRVTENAIKITKQTFLKRCVVPKEIKRGIANYPTDYEFFKHRDIYFYRWSDIEHFYW